MRRVLILISTAVLLISTSSRTLGARAGQATTFKNIKVLTGLSDDEIENAMLYMRGSLGVECEHCHTRADWSEDDKKQKRTAREMIRIGSRRPSTGALRRRPGRDLLHVPPRTRGTSHRAAAAAREPRQRRHARQARRRSGADPTTRRFRATGGYEACLSAVVRGRSHDSRIGTRSGADWNRVGRTDGSPVLQRTHGIAGADQSATESVLGRLPRRFEYDDYRLVDGVRLPFRYREVDADYTVLVGVHERAPRHDDR